MDEFTKEIFGYEIPEGVPEQVEGTTKYHQHQTGLYFGFVGKIIFEYINSEKRRCEPDTPGAMLSGGMLPLWITEYHGTTANPVVEEIININTLLLPEGKSLAECYYPVRISFNPEEQWKNRILFGSWGIKEKPNLRIISRNPARPNVIITNFKAFPAYYGMRVKFSLALSDKGNTYIEGKKDSITLLSDKIPIEKMLEFENRVQAKIDAERAEREKNKSKFIREAPPETNFNELVDSESDDLADFING